MNTELLKSNGVDLDKALELFGDMEMYNETLNDFLSTVEAKKNNLNKYLLEGNMPSYAIDVHSLKSDARYLGFTELGEAAYNLEMASKGNDIDFVKNNHNALIALTDKYIELSKKYFENSGIKEETPVVNNTPSTTTLTGKDTILVADDSEIVANFVKRVFNGIYEVVTAGDGKECIDLINSPNSSSIKCLLLDLNMPNVNGFQVLDYFKENDLFKKIPVSIITGNEEEMLEAFSYPIIDALKKPFTDSNVKDIVNRTIGRQ